jgi:hypothetical protein
MNFIKADMIRREQIMPDEEPLESKKQMITIEELMQALHATKISVRSLDGSDKDKEFLDVEITRFDMFPEPCKYLDVPSNISAHARNF